ncbi:MAG: DUF971 domain-containing protein [Acidimicrobiales bacterium]|nr:DUF971 domain-containing protein [Acidimicrobiales bacterium]
MPAQPAVEVVDVEVRRDDAVTVEWADGRTARFGLDELRASCPCAACRTLRDRGEPAWPRPGAPDVVAITRAELVGAWGISFVWNDGHATGIYPWDSLRRWADERPPA